MNINIISQSLRPVTHCKFRRSSAKALYDTGSCVTCMSEETYHNLQPDEKSLSRTGRSFRSASGNQMKTKGSFDLQMLIEGRSVKQNVHVIPQLHEPFILGIDFIRNHGLSYCPKHHHFYWEENCPLDHGSILVLKDRMVIPPLCSRICSVKVEGPYNLGTVGIATIRMSDMPWIRGGPVLTERDDAQQILMEIRNASPVPRELPRNCKIGIFETVDEENIVPIECLQGEPEAEEAAVSSVGRNPKWNYRVVNRGHSGDYHPKKNEDKFIDNNVNLKCANTEKPLYMQMFYEHSSVFSKHKNDLGRCGLVQHEIHLKDKNPVYIKQFKIPEVHATSIEEQVKEWLKLDIVQPSMSRFNSPIFVVKKKDGAFRLVQDFRALNAQTYPDRYSMRDVTDCIHEIGKSGSTIFSTIDLTSGFWQMVLKPECRPYTAFTVYGMGQFEFKTSPMGLLGCPASFQRLMEAVMKGIPNVLVYIDDILVHSKTHEEHRRTLDLVFRRLKRHNLKIRLEKCFFATTEVEYLGFRLTPDGVLPGTDKTAVIKNAAPPDNVQRVRQFLGLCNFFRNHIKDFATRSHPLTVLTRKDCAWKGGPLPTDALNAFNELKTALTSSPIISFPRKDRQYALITDAASGDSNNPGGMGAILTQIDKEGKFYVIAYASRKLIKHEMNYTPFLLEMHAAVWGMEHFSHHLKGQRFLLFTDHKPLEKLGKVHTKTLYRIQEAMMEYDFEIFYKKGDEMPADFLSRNICSLIPELSLENISRLQKLDPQLKTVINYVEKGIIPNSSSDRQLIAKYGSRCFLDKGVLWIRFHRPEIGSRAVICLPTPLRKPAIEHMHSSWYGGHAGTLKTVERLLLYYYWPNIHNEVQSHLSECERCQKRQTAPSIPSAKLQPLPLLSEPNQRIHADLFGPLKTSDKGKKFILVMTDAFTRYVELVAIENKETETVANAIFVHWICRYGVPLEIVTDQGKEFVSHICQTLWDKLELIHNTTTPRHPQANSQAEVVNRSIIRYLASFVDDSTLDWECFLAPLMFSYNTTFHRSLKTSPFFMTFGLHPRLPPEIVRPQYGSDLPTEIMQRLQVARNVARSFMDKAALEYKEQHDRKAKERLFHVNQEVLLDEHSFLHKNQKLCPKFSGPHIITRLKGDVDVELLLDTGRRVVVHVNRIKPFRSDASTPANSFQNGGGVDNALNVGDDGRHNGLPMGAPSQRGQDTSMRLTRSKAKEQGLVFNKDTLDFSPTETLQAIRSGNSFGKRKRGAKKKTKQVISHYISRDIDGEEEEWDAIPEWDNRVDPKIEPGESSEDEFLDTSEGEFFTPKKDEPEPKLEPKPPAVPPRHSPQKPKPPPTPKSVKFDPVVTQFNYNTDAELQKIEEDNQKAQNLLRIAKAAVEKVKEEIEDATSKRLPTGHGRGGSPTKRVPGGTTGTKRTTDGGSLPGTNPDPGTADTSVPRVLTPTKYRKPSDGTTGQDGGRHAAGTSVARAQDDGEKPSGRTLHVPTVGGASGTSSTGQRLPLDDAKPAHPGVHALPAFGAAPTFGAASTFGSGPCVIPGMSADQYAAASGFGAAAAATSASKTAASDGGLGGSQVCGGSLGQEIPHASFQGTLGRTFGTFGGAQLPTFGDISEASRGGNDGTAGRIPRTDPQAEDTDSSKAKKTETEGLRTTTGDGRGTKRDVSSKKTQPGTTGQTTRVTRSKQEIIRDEFGLYPFHPNPEGTNEAFYVTLLSERWSADRQQLRDRVINDDPPSEATRREHRRRYEFILREAERTGAKLHKYFKID